MYTWNDGSYLMHHGILGQRWGKRNGPPYPLDAKSHSKSEKDAGWRKSLNKSKSKQSKSIKDKWNDLDPKTKKAIKIGAMVSATTIAVYGLYKVSSINKVYGLSGTIDKTLLQDIQNSEFDKDPNPQKLLKITESAKMISEQSGLKLKDTAFSAIEDADILYSKSDRTNNDCGPLTMNFVLRRLGLDVVSTGNDEWHAGGMSFAEFGYYFKGVNSKKIEVENNSNFKNNIFDAISTTISESDDGVGVLEFVPKDSNDTGHFIAWYSENGQIKIKDVQNKIDNLDRYNLGPYKSFRIARLDNLEVKAKNLVGNPSNLDVQKITKNL